MDHLNHFDLMRRYAIGQMSAVERAEFEQRLAHDPALASEWADYQLIAVAVGQHKPDAAAVRAAMQSAQDELRAEGFFDDLYSSLRQNAQTENPPAATPQPVQQARRVLLPPTYVWWATAASALILVAAWWLWPRSSSLPLFDLQAELLAGHRHLGFAEQDTAVVLRKWLSEGRSDAVIAYYDRQIVAQNGTTMGAEEEYLERRLCYGLALLQREQYRTALVALEWVVQHPDATFEAEYEARYFAAQAYLSLGDVARGSAALRRVADDVAKGNGQKSAYAAAAARRLAALEERGYHISPAEGGRGRPNPSAPQRRDFALDLRRTE